MSAKRYFLDQDNDCHWYLVEADQLDAWDAWRNLDSNDQASWDVPEFAEPLGGSPRITFENPSDKAV